MFVLADSEKMGQYLAGCIDQQFKSRRQFCRAYLVAKGERADSEQIRKMSNRLSQILNGKKEIPTLYQMSFYSSPPKTCDQYYNAKLMEALIHADSKTLEYFSEEFEIADSVGYPNRFLFPFMGELIERLLQNKSDFAEYMLKDAIQHNQYVYDQLAALLTDTVRSYRKLYYDMTNPAVKNDLAKGILRDLCFYDDGNLVSYFALFPGTKKGLKSNIIQINTKSADAMINRRISELNNLYHAIHHITPNFEGSSKQY